MAHNRKKQDEEEGIKMICRNRRAFHEYTIGDRLECGIVLTGTEVKSLREGSASLEDAYAKVEDEEVWLLGSDIPEYSMAHRMSASSNGIVAATGSFAATVGRDLGAAALSLWACLEWRATLACFKTTCAFVMPSTFW